MTDTIPSVTLHDDIKYYTVDPFRQTKAWKTETQGALPVGTTGYVRLSNSETAAEVKEKQPWALVTPAPNRKPHGAVFTWPGVPYETEWDRRHAKKEEVEDG